MSWLELKNKETNNDGASSEKLAYVKIPEGTTKYRVRDGEPVSRWSHWIQQANEGKGMGITCTGKGCKICAILAEDKKNKVKSKYNSQKKHSLNVINRATGKIEILDQGNKIFEGLLTVMEQMGDLRNYDITITRKGTGQTDTTYTVLPVFPPIPLTAEEEAMKLYDLNAINAPFTSKQIDMILTGVKIDEVIKAEAPQETPNTEPQEPQGAVNSSTVDYNADPNSLPF